jgi:hypothetical protein
MAPNGLKYGAEPAGLAGAMARAVSERGGPHGLEGVGTTRELPRRDEEGAAHGLEGMTHTVLIARERKGAAHGLEGVGITVNCPDEMTKGGLSMGWKA